MEWLFGKNFDPDKDIGDLSGKTVLVTGGTCLARVFTFVNAKSLVGNTGLGAASILVFAKHNARVFLAARTQSKGEAAITDIKTAAPNADVVYLQLDLSSLIRSKTRSNNSGHHLSAWI